MSEITPLDRSQDRTGFDCGVPELNAFLRATARQHAQKGISRTFVLTGGSPAILGYFTLTLCELHMEHLPTTYAKKYPQHGLPAVRLARLAVSLKARKRGYGELLLSEAIRRTALISQHAGVIGLFVDAKDESAERFYGRYGFLAIAGHPSQLFLPMETIRSTI